MGSIDIHVDVSEDEYAFLRLQALKLNSSIPGYIKRLILEERKKKSSSVSLFPRGAK